MSTKILVVDDSKFNVKVITDILEVEGYEIYSTNSGLEVVEMAYKINPEVILLDIVMPDLDGFEVCKLLKTQFEIKDIPIIMITSKSDSSDVKKALELGAFDYIRKPLDNVEVIARIQSALRFKHHQDKLKEMAMKDGLTGLYNHALLIDIFQKEFSRQERNKKSISFMMMDIDHFKKVNDTYGHLSGDLVLKNISEVITKSLRSCDVSGRYGGEEFSVILTDMKREGVLQLCERVRQNIESHEFNIGRECIKITVSIGAYYKSPEDVITASEMIKKADEAMYRVKGNGRNKVELDFLNIDYIK